MDMLLLLGDLLALVVLASRKSK